MLQIMPRHQDVPGDWLLLCLDPSKLRAKVSAAGGACFAAGACFGGPPVPASAVLGMWDDEHSSVLLHCARMVHGSHPGCSAYYERSDACVLHSTSGEDARLNSVPAPRPSP